MRLISKRIIDLVVLPVEFKHWLWLRTIAGMWHPISRLCAKPLICYTCGQTGHHSAVCRWRTKNSTPSGTFVKGQWPIKRFDATSNGRRKLPQCNMHVLSDENESDSYNDKMVLEAWGTRAKQEFWRSKVQLHEKMSKTWFYILGSQFILWVRILRDDY